MPLYAITLMAMARRWRLCIALYQPRSTTPRPN